jgi:hypothetical protein
LVINIVKTGQFQYQFLRLEAFRIYSNNERKKSSSIAILHHLLFLRASIALQTLSGRLGRFNSGQHWQFLFQLTIQNALQTWFTTVLFLIKGNISTG